MSVHVFSNHWDCYLLLNLFIFTVRTAFRSMNSTFSVSFFYILFFLACMPISTWLFRRAFFVAPNILTTNQAWSNIKIKYWNTKSCLTVNLSEGAMRERKVSLFEQHFKYRNFCKIFSPLQRWARGEMLQQKRIRLKEVAKRIFLFLFFLIFYWTIHVWQTLFNVCCLLFHIVSLCSILFSIHLL